jgi:hypothetical protein
VSLISYKNERDRKAEEDDGVFGLTLIQEREPKSPVLLKQGDEQISFLGAETKKINQDISLIFGNEFETGKNNDDQIGSQNLTLDDGKFDESYK